MMMLDRSVGFVWFLHSGGRKHSPGFDLHSAVCDGNNKLDLGKIETRENMYNASSSLPINLPSFPFPFLCISRQRVLLLLGGG